MHVVPHEPQFVLSLSVSTQLPPQSVRPGSQVDTHVPDEHTSSASHALPHDPQSDVLEVVSMHAPSQSVSPPGHAHAESAHT